MTEPGTPPLGVSAGFPSLSQSPRLLVGEQRVHRRLWFLQEPRLLGCPGA